MSKFTSEIPEEKIFRLMNLIQVSYSLAKQLLRAHDCNIGEAVISFQTNPDVKEIPLFPPIVGKEDVLLEFMKEFSESPNENKENSKTVDPYVKIFFF
jgi:hypothetical protein